MNLDVDWIRKRFPALAKTRWAYFDNGGGSQIAQPVVDRMSEYLLTSNVQHGASYDVSRLATERLAQAHRALATLVHAADPSEIVVGGSTSQLLRTFAECFSRKLVAGDEIVVSSGDHESNIAPWMDLQRFGIVVKVWHLDERTLQFDLDALEALLSPRTRLVTVTHASNVLGTINPIRELADRVHANGALLCVDGVGFAPHRAIDVQALGADLYVFSCYKVFGPHCAVLFGKKDVLLGLPGKGFFFHGEDDVPYKFQPGGVNYELTYAMLGLLEYLQSVAGHTTGGLSAGHPDGEVDLRASVEAAFDLFAEHEERLTKPVLDFLRDRAGVRLVGLDDADRHVRVPIISFVLEGNDHEDVVRRVDSHEVAIRFGHFYSARLVQRLGLSPDQGVVRISMAHYNSLSEVDRLLAALDDALP